MESYQPEISENQNQIHWGHFGFIILAAVSLTAVSYFEKPEMFKLHSSQTTAVSDSDLPHYYAYVTPAEDIKPLVAGASTNQGPSVINEDGTVSNVDMGQVLGASTQDVQLNFDDIKVNTIPDSTEAINNFLNNFRAAQNGPIDNADFEAALSSNDQTLIDKQAQKLILIKDTLYKMSVPIGLEKLDQLTIIQYNSAIGVLQNFTKADQNPELVGQDLNQFLKSQQDIDTEDAAVTAKYNLDPILLGAIDVETTNTNNAGQ